MSIFGRGQASRTVISMPSLPVENIQEAIIKDSQDERNKAFGIHISNAHSQPLELFYPILRAIQSVTVQPSTTCSR